MDNLSKARCALDQGSELSNFISVGQRRVLAMLLYGEESSHFVEIILELEQRIANMPTSYETQGQGADAVVHLHYFNGGVDAWITEKDKGDGEGDELPRQTQAFGAVKLFADPEFGYVNLEELLENDLELDLYWDTTKTLKDVM